MEVLYDTAHTTRLRTNEHFHYIVTQRYTSIKRAWATTVLAHKVEEVEVESTQMVAIDWKTAKYVLCSKAFVLETDLRAMIVVPY